MRMNQWAVGFLYHICIRFTWADTFTQTANVEVIKNGSIVSCFLTFRNPPLLSIISHLSVELGEGSLWVPEKATDVQGIYLTDSPVWSRWQGKKILFISSWIFDSWIPTGNRSRVTQGFAASIAGLTTLACERLKWFLICSTQWSSLCYLPWMGTHFHRTQLH